MNTKRDYCLNTFRKWSSLSSCPRLLGFYTGIIYPKLFCFLATFFCTSSNKDTTGEFRRKSKRNRGSLEKIEGFPQVFFGFQALRICLLQVFHRFSVGFFGFPRCVVGFPRCFVGVPLFYICVPYFSVGFAKFPLLFFADCLDLVRVRCGMVRCGCIARRSSVLKDREAIRRHGGQTDKLTCSKADSQKFFYFSDLFLNFLGISYEFSYQGVGVPLTSPISSPKKFRKHSSNNSLIKICILCTPRLSISSSDENPYAKPHREWRPPRPPHVFLSTSGVMGLIRRSGKAFSNFGTDRTAGSRRMIKKPSSTNQNWSPPLMGFGIRILSTGGNLQGVHQIQILIRELL